MRNITLIALITAALLGGADHAFADGFWSNLFTLKRMKEVDPVRNELHQEECGACHFAYPPGLLPEQSWRKLMAADALADHFGDDAELSEQPRTRILAFLVANSADKSPYKRSKKIMASLQHGEAPLRITATPYIRRKHHEIPEKLIKGPKVGSLSYCDKCHTRAENGNFDDDSVDIPGYGRWTW